MAEDTAIGAACFQMSLSNSCRRIIEVGVGYA